MDYSLAPVPINLAAAVFQLCSFSYFYIGCSAMPIVKMRTPFLIRRSDEFNSSDRFLLPTEQESSRKISSNSGCLMLDTDIFFSIKMKSL